MNQASIFFFFLFQFIALALPAQDFQWEKNKTGHLYTPKNAPPAGFKIKEVYEIVNRVPAIAHPVGYDVNEWFAHSTSGKRYTASMHINFFKYYRYQNGKVERSTAHAPTITVSVNQSKDLMDWQSYLFSEETEALHAPPIFTDTFEITYKEINGCRVGEGVNTSAGTKVKFWVLNPKGRRFFRPVTKEEYLKVFIENLRKKVEADEKGLTEAKEALAQMENNPLLKKGADDFRQVYNNQVKFVNFEKSKLAHYRKSLATMTAQEKSSPAFCAFYTQKPIRDDNGNYIEKNFGELLYAPLESTQDTVGTMPLYTYYEKAMDDRLPKTAFQLITVYDAFDMENTSELKKFIDAHVLPNFPYTELMKLMDR
jgi:hypothetical protein